MTERESRRQKAEGRKKTFGLCFKSILLLTAYCLLPTGFKAFAWEHPLVHRLQEAQGKEKEVFSALPELKGYLLSAPSRGSAQNSLKNLTAASKASGTPALVNFYQALLSYWAENRTEAEKYLELAKSYTRGDVGTLWLMTQRTYRVGWNEAASRIVDQLREAAKDAGIKDLSLYSQTLVLFAQERAQAGDYAGAEEWLKKAELLSPHFTGLYFARAQLSLQKGYVHLPEAVKAVFLGYSAGLRHPWVAMSWSSHLYYALHWLLFFLFLIIPLGLFLKHTPLILHELQEFITRGPRSEDLGQDRPSQVIIGLTILCLFLPLLLGFGLLWQGLFWLLLFFPYANLKEKIWALALLLLLLAIPPLLAKTGAVNTLFTSPRSQLLMIAQESGYDASLIDQLKTLRRQEPKNPLIPYLSGLLYYRSGDFTKAESEFKSALELNPRWYPVMVNLGNAYFGMNALEQAAKEYQRALELYPKIVSAHYNISQIYTAQLKLTEARAEYDKAAKIDAELVASYEQSPSPNHNRRLMEQRLSSTEFLAWALPPEGEARQFTRNLWDGRLWGVSMAGAPMILILVLILTLALALVRKRGNLAQYCQKCGQAYCKKCHPQQRGERYCLPCNAIFVKKDAVVVQRKVERQIEVQKHQRRRRLYARVINLILPGLGHLYWGDSLKGLIFGSLAVSLIVFFLLPSPAYLPPWGGEPYAWRALIGGGLLALLYLVIQLDLHRRVKVR